MLMRDYALDLQARWDGATTDDMDLALEFLAFAEGRFLGIDFHKHTTASSASSPTRRTPASHTKGTSCHALSRRFILNSAVRN